MTAKVKYDDGVRVAIDNDVITLVDESMPKGLTRTSWINLLIQIGITNATFLERKELSTCSGGTQMHHRLNPTQS